MTELSRVVGRMNPNGVSGINVQTPFISMAKSAVIGRGAELGVPLGATWSCLDPKAKVHCGVCAQCMERRKGFELAEVLDTTDYADCRH